VQQQGHRLIEVDPDAETAAAEAAVAALEEDCRRQAAPHDTPTTAVSTTRTTTTENTTTMTTTSDGTRSNFIDSRAPSYAVTGADADSRPLSRHVDPAANPPEPGRRTVKFSPRPPNPIQPLPAETPPQSWREEYGRALAEAAEEAAAAAAAAGDDTEVSRLSTTPSGSRQRHESDAFASSELLGAPAHTEPNTAARRGSAMTPGAVQQQGEGVGSAETHWHGGPAFSPSVFVSPGGASVARVVYLNTGTSGDATAPVLAFETPNAKESGAPNATTTVETTSEQDAMRQDEAPSAAASGHAQVRVRSASITPPVVPAKEAGTTAASGDAPAAEDATPARGCLDMLMRCFRRE
jgi:hypothetical protein